MGQQAHLRVTTAPDPDATAPATGGEGTPWVPFSQGEALGRRRVDTEQGGRRGGRGGGGWKGPAQSGAKGLRMAALLAAQGAWTALVPDHSSLWTTVRGSHLAPHPGAAGQSGDLWPALGPGRLQRVQCLRAVFGATTHLGLDTVPVRTDCPGISMTGVPGPLGWGWVTGWGWRGPQGEVTTGESWEVTTGVCAWVGCRGRREDLSEQPLHL